MTMKLLDYNQIKGFFKQIDDYKKVTEKYTGNPAVVYVEIPSMYDGYNNTGIEEIIVRQIPIVLHVESSTLELMKQTGEFTTTR